MNNRQANAFRETVKKEEAANRIWEAEARWQRNVQMEAQMNGYPMPLGYQIPPQEYMSMTRGAPPPQQQFAQGVTYNAPQQPPQQMPDQRAVNYQQAVRVMENGEETGPPQSVHSRQVEVPFVRKVKVPVKTRIIVPTKIQKKVKTMKLVEVPSFKLVDETYTEVMEQPAVRNKEIWVKKVVPEKYMQKVPIAKTRQVQVPTTVLTEVDDYQIVEVDGSKAVEMDGYRVDEVQGSRYVEEDEAQQHYNQNYEAMNQSYNQNYTTNTNQNYNNAPPTNGMMPNRRMYGTQVYHVDDERIKDLPVDSQAPILPSIQPRASTSIPGPRHKARATTAVPANRTMNPWIQRAPKPCGFQLADFHVDGVVVKRVSRGSVADHAGVCVGDVVTRVANRPTRTLEEFRSVIDAIPAGNVQVNVNRGATGLLKLTFCR